METSEQIKEKAVNHLKNLEIKTDDIGSLFQHTKRFIRDNYDTDMGGSYSSWGTDFSCRFYLNETGYNFKISLEDLKVTKKERKIIEANTVVCVKKGCKSTDIQDRSGYKVCFKCGTHQ